MRTEAVGLLTCPKCGSEVKPDSKFCVKCGFNLEMAANAACPKCGKAIAPGNQFCTGCGYVLGGAKTAQPRKKMQIGLIALCAVFVCCVGAAAFALTRPGEPENEPASEAPLPVSEKAQPAPPPISAAVSSGAEVSEAENGPSEEELASESWKRAAFDWLRTEVEKVPRGFQFADNCTIKLFKYGDEGALGIIYSGRVNIDSGGQVPFARVRLCENGELLQLFSDADEDMTSSLGWERFVQFFHSIDTGKIEVLTVGTSNGGSFSTEDVYLFADGEWSKRVESIFAMGGQGGVTFYNPDGTTQGLYSTQDEEANTLREEVFADTEYAADLPAFTLPEGMPSWGGIALGLSEFLDSIDGIETKMIDKGAAPAAPAPELSRAEHDFSEGNVIAEASDTLLWYFQCYLDAINEQDASYLSAVTPEQAASLEDRIFGDNSAYIFTLDQILLDLDTVDIDTGASPVRVSFTAAFQFGNRNRSGGEETHGANVQEITMIFDEDDQAWLVASGEIVRGVEIGDNQKVLK
jgi:predicted nucleic acid-binding Zn ribbon protein